MANPDRSPGFLRKSAVESEPPLNVDDVTRVPIGFGVTGKRPAWKAPADRLGLTCGRPDAMFAVGENIRPSPETSNDEDLGADARVFFVARQRSVSSSGTEIPHPEGTRVRE
jgi:hypothetical protein